MKLKNRLLLLILTLAISCSSTSCNLALNNTSNLQNNSVWTKEVDNNTQNYRNLYSKALILEKDHAYKAAFDTLCQISPDYKIIYDFVLFKKAQIAKNIPDEQAVIDSLKELINNYRESNIRDIATYSLGQAYVRLSKDNEAKKYFEQTINNFPNTDYAIASYYYIGEILAKQKDKKPESINFFRQYLKNAPDGKFALNSVNAILKLSNNEDLTKEDYQNIGLAYYASGNYNNAVDFLQQNINEKTWFPLGKSFFMLDQKGKAESIFTDALTNWNNLDKNDVYNSLNLIASFKKSNKDAWSYCEQKFPKYADIALFFKIKFLKPNEKIAVYRKIINDFPESNYAPEAGWQIFWNLYNSAKYSMAINFAESVVKTYPDSKSVPKIVYWTAKAYEKAGQKLNAIKVYNRLISIFPGDYYYHRAKGRLNALKYGLPDFQWATNPTKTYNISWSKEIPSIYQYTAKNAGANISELLYLKDWDSIEIVQNKLKEPIVSSYVDLQNENKSRSIISVRDSAKDILTKAPGNDELWKLMYPLHNTDLITKYARINGLDSMLVQALTREESYFNPSAVSVSNARGLMQLIPSTAQAVANWEKLPSYKPDDLFKPAINLKLGARYLKYTHDRFNGNSMLAVAAYNGGPGSVNQWLSSIKKDDWDQFIENINYDETRNYIKKVFASYWNYKEIYKN